MEAQEFFRHGFVYLAAAVIAVPIARRLGLGSVLGYLLAGIAVGPFALGLVGREGQDVLHFAEIGVVMMLFLIGLELSPSELWRLRGVLLGMGGLQVIGTAAVLAALAASIFDLPARPAIALGAILSLSSTAIVLQSLREKGLMKTEAGERSFAVLLFQDLAVIPMLIVLPLLATGVAVADATTHAGSESWIATLPGWGQALATLGAVVSIVLAGRFGLPPVFRFIARRGARETFTAAALLIVVGIALLMESVGLSPALGTFLGGMVLAGSEYQHELEGDIEPFKGLLLGLFFIAVGASIDFGMVAESSGTIAGIVVALIAIKFGILFALGRVYGMSLSQNLLFAVALAQGGEFAFVLFSYAVQSGVLGSEIVNLCVASVALSMASTPLLLVLHERVIEPRLAAATRPEREPDRIDERNPVILAGFGAFGSVVGRFLVANGIETTVLDTDSDHIELMRRLGIKTFYGDASREEMLRAAGADEAKVLIVSPATLASTVAVIRTARKHFPHLRILARAKTRVDAYEVLEAGADRVYRTSLDTSLRTGVDALRELGFAAYQSHRAAQWFRRYDENAWRELADIRSDDAQYQGRARESVRLLEQLLRAEFHTIRDTGEGAWATEALRRDLAGAPDPDLG